MAWGALWGLMPWRQVTFHTNTSHVMHRFQTPMDPGLVEFYGGILTAATFEKNGVSVSVAKGTMAVMAASRFRTAFDETVDKIEREIMKGVDAL